jgi:riboflavin synthase
MFTGLVVEVGALARLERRGPAALATVQCRLGETEPLELGESISVAGVCLTVTRILPNGFTADVSSETLDKTTLGKLAVPARVNLERATPLGGRMGGHVVLGHVDGIGRVVAVEPSGDARRVTFETERGLAPYLAQKGSVAVDGVSLTVNEVADQPSTVRFGVMLVPHTLGATTLPALAIGSHVNLEMDVLARYVERQLGLRGASVGGEARDDAAAHQSSADERLLEKLRGGGYT